MNELICLAWHQKINVYYQDTDSIHILENQLPLLEKTYFDAYQRVLVGTELCQFHSDFAPVNGLPSKSRKLIAVGKKCYMDILVNDRGEQDYHFRLKGIPQNVIVQHCIKNNLTIEQLYMNLYNGISVKFNLLDGAQCFRKDKTYQQFTMESFVREIKFK